MGKLNPENGRDNGNIERRRFLQGAVGAIGVAALGTSGLASAEPSRTVNLGDEGLTEGDDIDPYLADHWSPGVHLIVPGGTYQMSEGALSIVADEDTRFEGDGMVTLEDPGFPGNLEAAGSAHLRVENVTFRGVDGSGHSTSATAMDDSFIELINVNRPDGSTTDGTTGFYLGNEHGGLTRFINCTVSEFPDNGIYATSFAEGDSNDEFGTVEIYGGLYENNGVQNIRIGGDDAKVMHAACLWNDANHGNSGDGIVVREAGSNILIQDCDIVSRESGSGRDAIEVRPDLFEGPGPSSAHLEDIRVRQENPDAEIVNAGGDYDIDGNNIHLTGGGDYDMEGSGPYDNVYTDGDADSPTTAKRFVDPSTLEPVDSGGSTDDSSDSTTPSEHTLEINTYWDSGILYDFTVSGSVAGGDDAEVGDGGNDTITDNGDGTMTVSGETGNGYSDDYVFDGDVTSWSAERHPDNDSGEYELVLDGNVVTPEELTGSSSDGDSTNDDSSTDDGSTSDTAPSIDRFEVTEAGSPNPHADITADWGVSDSDGNLSSVLVQVLDASGFVVDASRSSVNGTSAYDVDYFKVKHADGQSFDVRINVTDEADNSATDTVSVTE